ncbi:MAG TPA: efflux RND transporter periplasmic adaptor subunit [Steroidobacteraceae bacterium]|jgi:membrane fusion protein (multidrug efflux system)
MYRQRLILVLILAFAGLISGCGEKADGKTPDAKDDKEAPAIPVEVRTPRRAEMVAVYSGTASLEADEEAAVVAKVGGEVRAILVEEGRAVRAGQVLARLDGDQLRLEAQKASATLAKLERDYRRNVELHDKGLVSPGAFENLKFEVDAQRAAYELAQLQLSYTEIRAPIDGVVAERFVKVGNTIKPNDVLFKVTDLKPLVVYVHIPERELERLKPGQPAAIHVDAVPQQAFVGHVARISPVVDPQTATFKATIEVDDPSERLKPGMFARVGIVYERREQALQIPRTAIIDDQGQSTVFIVEDGKAQQRRIRVGLTNDGLVEVTDGLKGQEQVVVVGQGGLKTGNAVRVVELEAPNTKR